MGFISLVYHEIRPEDQLNTKPQGIMVADGYEDELPEALYVSTTQFEAQMKYLKDEGFNFITLDDLFMYYGHEEDLRGKNVLITFDDAFQSLRYYAHPILQKYDIPGTLFVVRDWLFDKETKFEPQTSKVLSLDEIMDLKDVFIFANHTAGLHRKNELQHVSASALFEDLDNCGWITDYPNVFAYPFGYVDEDLVEKLDTWGMKLAFTTKPGFNDRDTNELLLNRNIVPGNMNLDDFKIMIEGTLKAD